MITIHNTAVHKITTNENSTAPDKQGNSSMTFVPAAFHVTAV